MHLCWYFCTLFLHCLVLIAVAVRLCFSFSITSEYPFTFNNRYLYIFILIYSVKVLFITSLCQLKSCCNYCTFLHFFFGKLFSSVTAITCSEMVSNFYDDFHKFFFYRFFILLYSSAVYLFMVACTCIANHIFVKLSLLFLSV